MAVLSTEIGCSQAPVLKFSTPVVNYSSTVLNFSEQELNFGTPALFFSSAFRLEFPASCFLLFSQTTITKRLLKKEKRKQAKKEAIERRFHEERMKQIEELRRLAEQQEVEEREKFEGMSVTQYYTYMASFCLYHKAVFVIPISFL